MKLIQITLYVKRLIDKRDNIWLKMRYKLTAWVSWIAQSNLSFRVGVFATLTNWLILMIVVNIEVVSFLFFQVTIIRFLSQNYVRDRYKWVLKAD